MTYRCGYCGTIKKSSSQCADGRVRIRCECGGQHQDNHLRMHATWIPVPDAAPEAAAPAPAALPLAPDTAPAAPAPALAPDAPLPQAVIPSVLAANPQQPVVAQPRADLKFVDESHNYPHKPMAPL